MINHDAALHSGAALSFFSPVGEPLERRVTQACRIRILDAWIRPVSVLLD